MKTQFTACGSQSHSAFLHCCTTASNGHFQNQVLAAQNHFDCRFEEVGLANTGSKRKHSKTRDIKSNENAEQCTAQGRSRKDGTYGQRDNLSPHRCIWYKIILSKQLFEYPCTCVIKYNSFKDFLTDSLAAIYVSTIQNVLTRVHVKERVVTLKFLQFIYNQNRIERDAN